MAIRPSTISRFRASTRFMSVAVEPVTMPKRSAWRTRSATFALQISFLLGRQLVFGQEPPINLRSTTAVRCPDLAMCQARYLPPSPLPRTSISKCSGRDIFNSSSFGSERLLLPRRQLAVPVDDGGCTCLIHKIDVKALAGRECDARFCVRPDQAEYSCRFAVDVEGSGAGSQAKLGGVGFGRGSSPRHRQERDRAGHGNAGRKDHLPSG